MDSASMPTQSATNPSQTATNPFQALNLNERMQSPNSVLVRNQIVPAYEFAKKYEVQSDKAKISKLSVANFIKRTGTTSATADFSANASMNIRTTSTFDSPHGKKAFFGVPYVGIFEGTTLDTAHEIFPLKGTAVAGTYTVTSGYEYLNWQGSAPMAYSTQITNTAGTSSQDFTYLVDIEFVDYVASEGG